MILTEEQKSQFLADFSGEIFADKDGTKLTVRLTCVRSLGFPYEGQSSDERIPCFVLGKKIHDDGDCELTVEELSLLKKLVGKYPWSGYIVGPLYCVIDPACVPLPAKPANRIAAEYTAPVRELAANNGDK